MFANLNNLGETKEIACDRCIVGGSAAGITRMASDPAKGIVNPECRLFDVENISIAGSSVFPTIGYANPTLTIVALALRLAEHLKKQLA